MIAPLLYSVFLGRTRPDKQTGDPETLSPTSSDPFRVKRRDGVEGTEEAFGMPNGGNVWPNGLNKLPLIMQ